jgi:hypothetical protein
MFDLLYFEEAACKWGLRIESHILSLSTNEIEITTKNIGGYSIYLFLSFYLFVILPFSASSFTRFHSSFKYF